MGQYFTSPISYVIAGALLILTGLYFNGDVAYSLTVKPINPSLIPDFMATAMIFFGPWMLRLLMSFTLQLYAKLPELAR